MIKFKKIICVSFVFCLAFGQSVFADAEKEYQTQCRKQILGEVNFMTNKYIEWLEKKIKAKSTVSKDIVPLLFGKKVTAPVTEKPNPAVLGMLSELSTDFSLLCMNAQREDTFLDKCRFQDYKENGVSVITQISVKKTWDYCNDLTWLRLRDLEDFTEIEVRRDAADEKLEFVLRKYKHIVNTLENLAYSITWTKYYIATMAELVDCFAQSCVP